MNHITSDLKATDTGLAGLTTTEAEELRSHYGSNTIPEKKQPHLLMFLRRFWGIIPWMLELAAILDLVLGRFAEAGVIVFILSFQAIMGFRQETKTKKALLLLRKRLSVNARVKRDGKWLVLPAADLVPGDLLHVRVGDIVPADMEISGGTISVDQSQLTGESLPVDAHAGQTVYSGTVIRSGEADGVVRATGAQTYFGKTIEIAQLAKAPQRFQRLTVNIARYLLVFDVILAGVVLTVRLSRGDALLGILPFVLILLVISVPVLLPMMAMTSALRGAGKLVKSGVLTTQLPSIENAAAMDVLCVDKTGTITENKLSLGRIEPFDQYTSQQVLRFAILASDESTQDPIDIALIRAGTTQRIDTDHTRVQFIPFDPSTKRSEAVFISGQQERLVLKGAPFEIARLTGKPWDTLKDRVSELSSDGSRVLAVAEGDRNSLNLVGLVALVDQPREDSARFIKELILQGLRVVMITGDGKATAQAIASQVGIKGEIAPPGTITDTFDTTIASRFNVFTNVFPKEKYLLVQALQQAGHIVGMTGDGVNDVPALRQADVGIAVDSATDVAKSAAGFVLTKPGLSEILLAIKASRKIFSRMQTWVLAMIIRKVGLPMFISLGTLLFMRLVINPLQVVMFMFMGEVATFAVSFDQVTPSATPKRWNLRPLAITGLLLALVLFVFNCLVFYLGYYYFHLDLETAQTGVFVWMVFSAAQAVIYSTRAKGLFWQKPYPSRPLIYASLFDVALTIVVACTGILMPALSLPYIFGILLLSLIFLVLFDISKVLSYRLTQIS